jgi:hypothetical protein
MTDGGIPNIAPMAAEAEKNVPLPVSAVVRPLHPQDIRDGLEALNGQIAAGMPLDRIATVVAVLRASGMVSVRAERNSGGQNSHGRPRKEKADGASV